MSDLGFERQIDEKGNISIAMPGSPTLTVINEGDIQGFTRVAIRVGLDAANEKERTRWAVGELDGVRVYVQGDHVILTKQDLYP